MRNFKRLIRLAAVLGIFALLTTSDLCANQDIAARVEELERRMANLERLVEELRSQRPGPPPVNISQLDPMGPYFHEVRGAISKDGLEFEVLAGPFFQHASVPDVLELTKDSKAGKRETLLVYFVDGSVAPPPGVDTICMATSIDGKTWSQKKKVVLAQKHHTGWAVDPSVVELPDGRIRMYFIGMDLSNIELKKPNPVYSAISEDGVYFEAEPGIRFISSGPIIDPEVIRAEEEWLMFFWEVEGQPGTFLACSKDGLKFELNRNFHLDLGIIPGAVRLPSGKVRIFVVEHGGIMSAVFDPASGSPPVIEKGARIEGGADPSPVRRLDGTYYLAFKTIMKDK